MRKLSISALAAGLADLEVSEHRTYWRSIHYNTCLAPGGPRVGLAALRTTPVTAFPDQFDWVCSGTMIDLDVPHCCTAPTT